MKVRSQKRLPRELFKDIWKEETTDEKDKEDEGAERVNRAMKIMMNSSAVWFIGVSAVAQNHLSWQGGPGCGRPL